MFLKNPDSLWRITCKLGALITGSLILLILVFLALETAPAVRALGLARFFHDPGWFPSSTRGAAYNLLPMVAGTLAVTGLAMSLAAPLGLGAGIFMHQVAPAPIAVLYRRLLELLAGIPSVIYGFWGLVVLVPLINNWQGPGTSVLAGSLILAAMILPMVALNADAAIAAVPRSYLDAAAALGFGKTSTLWRIVLPCARRGLFTGMLLALGRALGETMAVLMVCGNVIQVPDSLFAPVRTLSANIALEMAYALGNHRGALFLSGLVLMVVVALLVVAARTFGDRGTHA